MWRTEQPVGEEPTQQDAQPSDHGDHLVSDHIGIYRQHVLDQRRRHVEGRTVQMGAVERFVERRVSFQVGNEPQRLGALLGLIPCGAKVRRHGRKRAEEQDRYRQERPLVWCARAHQFWPGRVVSSYCNS